MGDKKLLVVIIRTPGSDRYMPIESLIKKDTRFKIEYIDASMTQSYIDVMNKNISYSTEIFEYFKGRKLTPAEIGCADSHNRARNLIYNSIEGGVILEDDARITDVDSFFTITTKFLVSQGSIPSILNLTGFRQLGFKVSDRMSSKNNRYIKLWGNPDLAVCYAITKKAAGELLRSNIPIINTSDWPATNCCYFVPLSPLASHGDVNTISLIDPQQSNFRNGESLVRKLSYLLFLKFFIERPKGVGVSDFIRIVYIERMQWRANYIKIKLQLGFQK